MKNVVLIQLLIATVFLAAAIAVYALAFLHVEDIGSRIVYAEAEGQHKNIELMNIRDAQNALAALTASEMRVKGYFVPTTEVVAFLERVGTTGDAFGADVSVVGVTEDTSGTGRGMLTLSIQTHGTFASVMRTLGTLEFAPYDITLKNLSLDATDAENGAWTASATFDVGTKTP